MKVKYVGPFDGVEIPDLGGAVKKDSALDVESPDVAAGLLRQPANFEPVDDEAEALLKRLDSTDDDGDELDALTVDQLKDVADDEGADRVGLTKKDDLIAAIRLHRETEGA